METSRPLIVIPARGGSKGIPRKNLRPLCGKPLIAYAIEAALSSKNLPRVVVSTEDDEIALFARRFGADVIMRPLELAEDTVTIDPVILHATTAAEQLWKERYNPIVTVQPTSPLLHGEDIDQALSYFKEDPLLETVISAIDDRHLRWKKNGHQLVPEYTTRVNRQQLPAVFRETGAIIACRRDILENGTRIGAHLRLYVMEEDRSVDIDSMRDFWLCESILARKRIGIAVTGNRVNGMGHVYRMVMLAHELVNYELHFICEETDDLAIDYIRRHNYQVHVTPPGKRLDTLLELRPSLLINDILDTSADYILALKKQGMRVVNFEDMGLGAETADLVINALYPHQIPSSHILTGPRWFCLRDEFLHVNPLPLRSHVERILVTFGGADEGNLTGRVLQCVGSLLVEAGIQIDVILGPGYAHGQALNNLPVTVHPFVNIVSETRCISDYMAQADFAITSGGRTVLELAALNIPTIVICQNLRETTHTFASSENGIINLGLRTGVSDEEILRTVTKVMEKPDLRAVMREKSAALNLAQGKKRVIEHIISLLND